MLKQEMFSFDEEKLSKTVYIKASQQDTIASINHDIKLIEKAGYKYHKTIKNFFISAKKITSTQ